MVTVVFFAMELMISPTGQQHLIKTALTAPFSGRDQESCSARVVGPRAGAQTPRLALADPRGRPAWHGSSTAVDFVGPDQHSGCSWRTVSIAFAIFGASAS